MKVFKNTCFNSFLLFFCLTLFVNCNFDEQILESNFDNNDFNNLATGNTNSDNDVSDFSWDKVNWLHTNVSDWEESSQIASIKVKSNGQICIDYTERGQWTSKDFDGTELAGNPWVIVKISGQYYAGTYEWLRPGQECKFGHAPDTDSLTKVYNNEWGQHVKISPLKEWIPQGGDVVGFMVSGLARNNVRNVHKRTNIQWYRLPSVDGSIQGQMLHSTSGSDNNGGDNNDICSSDQKEPHYKEVNGQCLPSCGHANNLYCKSEAQSGRQCGEIARGARCSDTDDFEIHILDTYEQKACCNRRLKPGRANNVCHPDQNEPHYRVAGQECLPSCGHAANMAGYGGRGPDGQRRTSDDPHTYTKKANSCEELGRLGHLGHSDWKNFSWTDKHTSKTMSNSQIYEVVKNGGVCCVRGNPTNPPVTTSTTTTTQTQNNNGLSSRSDNPPNMLHVARRVANAHNQVLRDSCRRGHENLNFLDLVLTELRKENEGIRWGFNCKRGNCNDLSIDAIAYYRGTGNPNNSSDVAIIDIIAGCHGNNPQPAWTDVTQATVDAGAIGRYKYPR